MQSRIVGTTMPVLEFILDHSRAHARFVAARKMILGRGARLERPRSPTPTADHAGQARRAACFTAGRGRESIGALRTRVRRGEEWSSASQCGWRVRLRCRAGGAHE